MLLKANQKRALKGFIHAGLMDSKKIYVTVGAILGGSLLMNLIISTLMVVYGQNSNSNAGSLTTGFFIVAVTMFISAISMSVGKEVKACFAFPMDRMVYTFGNFIMFVINSLGLLLLVSLGFLLETVMYKILSQIFDNFIYVNIVTVEAFIVGLWVSFCYILFFTTLTFLVFTLFARFRWVGVVSISLLVLLPLFFQAGRELIVQIAEVFIFESSISQLSLKLLGLALICQGLSYLTLRKMEVVK